MVIRMIVQCTKTSSGEQSSFEMFRSDTRGSLITSRRIRNGHLINHTPIQTTDMKIAFKDHLRRSFCNNSYIMVHYE